jgi:two-component system sensor histidine kinase KdpD
MQQTGWNQESEPFFPKEEDVHKKTMRNLRQFVIILAMLALTTVLNVVLEQIIQPSSLVFVYLVPTIAAAIYFGPWVSVIAFTCGFIIFDFGFVEPYYSLHISKPQDIYNVTVYFTIAALITYLINLVRHQNAFLKYRLDRVSLIEDMSRDFLLLTPMEKPSSDQNLLESLRPRVLSQLGQLALKYVRMILNVPAVVFFREADGSLKIWAKSSLDLEITEKENIAATWTQDNGEASGAGTHTYPDTPYFFIPMTSCEEIIGVLGILCDSKDLFPEQRRLLGTISNLTTIVVARWTRA